MDTKPLTLQDEIDQVIIKRITEALQNTKGNVQQAAKLLGVTKLTIYNNYKKFHQISDNVELLGKAGNPRRKKV